MQGWTPDFIPKITGDAVDAKVIHRLLAIPGAEAMACSQDLAKKEGIFVGITSGATLAAALKIAADAPAGTNILAMLPDTGERYLSTPLFADIPIEMTEEEQAIFKSTPYGQ
jgi:cysteine synthase A